MIELLENNIYRGYRVKLIVAVERDNMIKTRNQIIVPKVYDTLEEAQAHVEMDLKYRLSDSLYFRSQKLGYALVRYSREASLNTYISYRIVPLMLEKNQFSAGLYIKPIDTQKI
ncbi:MAG: hypothetical protein OEZ22_08990 [Spirochaetia bacterium]|nr:hypothetical protein [Spirochaetia bacterium]